MWTVPRRRREGLCPFSLLLCLIAYKSASNVVHYGIWMVVFVAVSVQFLQLFYLTCCDKMLGGEELITLFHLYSQPCGTSTAGSGWAASASPGRPGSHPVPTTSASPGTGPGIQEFSRTLSSRCTHFCPPFYRWGAEDDGTSLSQSHSQNMALPGPHVPLEPRCKVASSSECD